MYTHWEGENEIFICRWHDCIYKTHQITEKITPGADKQEQQDDRIQNKHTRVNCIPADQKLTLGIWNLKK